jgi:hypothetical protein
MECSCRRVSQNWHTKHPKYGISLNLLIYKRKFLDYFKNVPLKFPCLQKVALFNIFSGVKGVVITGIIGI